MRIAGLGWRARWIRDHALIVIAGETKVEVVSGVSVAKWNNNEFTVVFRSPFGNVREAGPAVTASARKPIRRYAMNINNHLNLLRIEWDQDDDLLIRLFHRGGWERRFLAL